MGNLVSTCMSVRIISELRSTLPNTKHARLYRKHFLTGIVWTTVAIRLNTCHSKIKGSETFVSEKTWCSPVCPDNWRRLCCHRFFCRRMDDGCVPWTTSNQHKWHKNHEGHVCLSRSLRFWKNMWLCFSWSCAEASLGLLCPVGACWRDGNSCCS